MKVASSNQVAVPSDVALRLLTAALLRPSYEPSSFLERDHLLRD